MLLWAYALAAVDFVWPLKWAKFKLNIHEAEAVAHLKFMLYGSSVPLSFQSLIWKWNYLESSNTFDCYLFLMLFLFAVVILLLFAEWCKEGLQEVQTFQGYHS